MMTFQAYCDKITTDIPIEISEWVNGADSEILTEVKTAGKFNGLFTTIKSILPRVESVEVPAFIEHVLSKVEETDDYPEDVPDDLIRYISGELFGKEIKDCNMKQQAIIKVIACYIILSK